MKVDLRSFFGNDRNGYILASQPTVAIYHGPIDTQCPFL
jgi:hypothetical protein